MDTSALEVIYKKEHQIGWKNNLVFMYLVFVIGFVLTLSVGSLRLYVVGLEPSPSIFLVEVVLSLLTLVLAFSTLISPFVCYQVVKKVNANTSATNCEEAHIEKSAIKVKQKHQAIAKAYCEHIKG